jgi:exodeoxyribonuclease VII large subunit
MASLFPEPEAILSVTALTNQVKGVVEKSFASVWVSGEITGYRGKHASGHVYFSLKDSYAQIQAVIWRSTLARMKFDLREGLEVIARGRVVVYPPQGKYQLEIERLEPKGVGAAELALRQLKEKLLTKGYFDPKRKKPLPRFPKRIVLVTSPAGAAVRDMLQVLGTRWPFAEVVLFPVRVQGDGAAEEIAAAIRMVNRFQAENSVAVDTLIVGRGGGSAEDLSAFNEEIVADAIFASRIPIVSAVGHEIDVSISDLVADVHATTPTDAANRVTPDRTEMLQNLREAQSALENRLRQQVRIGLQRLQTISTHGIFRRPLERIREQERRLDEVAARLNRAIVKRRDRQAERIATVAMRLESLSPLNVLSRGYSLTRKESSAELLRDASKVVTGDRIVTTLASGEIISRVEER